MQALHRICIALWSVTALAFFATLASADEGVVKEQNFANQAPPKVIAKTYYRCNLMQTTPTLNLKTGQYEGVAIFGTNNEPRTFIECNLINVLVPFGSVVKDCNTDIVQYDVAAGVEKIETPLGEVELAKTGMRVLGSYDGSKLQAVAAPTVVDTGSSIEADETRALVEEREGIVKRLAEIDAILAPRCKPVEPIEVKR